MRFTSYFASAISAFAAIASAQNPFTYPVNGNTLNAGSVVDLKWTPSTPGTVTLLVRSGNPGALNPGQTIATNITNSGSYSWTVPASITAGTDYAIEILDDANPNIYNYTPQFTINSSNTVSSAASSMSMTGSSSATSSGMSSSGTSSAMSMTGSSSMTGSMTGSTTRSATGSSSMRTGTSSTTASSMAAAGTVMATGEGNVVEKSGFAAVLAFAGVIAML